MSNPFGSTFESFGAPRGPLVEAVNQEQFQELSSLLDSGEGQLISLRAPRAGYGKTMLLSRLNQARQAQSLFIPVHLADGCRVEAENILEEILTQLVEVLPAGGGLTRLDLHTRRLFAQGLMPMVYSGEVPCQDREGAIASLRDRPAEAFDFHHEGAAIAQWSREQFALLGPRLSSVLSKASGASGRDVNYWIDLFFRFAIRPPSENVRTADMMEVVFGRQSRFRSEMSYLEGLGALLNLLTLVEPVVLVLDEVEGLFSDSEAALRAASFLTSLWESAPRLNIILSVNDDVWESAFAPRLPLGLRDRLEDVMVRLEPLSDEEAKALVTVRAGDETPKVMEGLDFGDGEPLYPRGVLRQARTAWNKRDQGKLAQPQTETVAAEAPVPTPEEPSPVAEDPAKTEQPAVEMVPEVVRTVSAVSSSAVEDTAPPAFAAEQEVPSQAVAAPPALPALREVSSPMKRASLPRKFHVQRLVPAVIPPPLVSAPPPQPAPAPPAVAPPPVTPAMAPPPVQATPQQISPFTNAPTEGVPAPPAQPIPQATATPAAIDSPFSVSNETGAAPLPQQAQPFSPVSPPAAPGTSPFALAGDQQPTAPPISQPSQSAANVPAAQPQLTQEQRLSENADAIDDLLRQFRQRNDG